MTTTRSSKTLIGLGTAAVTLVIVGLVVRTTSGFPQYDYDDLIWWGCDKCHGEFTDHTTFQDRLFPNGGKHGMHRNPTAMNTDCNLCHTTYGDNPATYSSAGTASTPGLSCTGCHGRDYGGEIGVTGAGLRKEHYTAGEELCKICHELYDPEPLPENVPPPYFGSYDTKAWDSCNEGPYFGENFSLDANGPLGLDNDGDGLYDSDDPDCGTVVPCPCDCDGTYDGLVGATDFLALLAQWGLVDTPCDFDGGGTGATDFLLLLANWGPCP